MKSAAYFQMVQQSKRCLVLNIYVCIVCGRGGEREKLWQNVKLLSIDIGDGQGGLVCCSSLGHRVGHD